METIKGIGTEAATLMVILDYPDKSQELHPDKFVVGTLLEQVIYEVIGAKPEEVYFTYAIKGKKEDALDYKATKRETAEWKRILKSELAVINPEVIVTLGEIAMQIVSNQKGITKRRGKLIAADGLESTVPVIPTYSESYVQLNNSNLNLWARDLHSGYSLSMGEVSTVSPTKAVYCDTISKVEEAIKYCREVGLVVFDFETPNIGKKGTFEEGFHATMLSLTFQAGSGYVIPIEHKDTPYSTGEIGLIMPMLRERLFEDRTIRKIAHNAMYDCHILRLYGIKVYGRLDDTMLMHHLYDETERHGLKELVSTYYPEYAGYEEGTKGMKFENIPISVLTQYAATDTDMTFRLCVLLESFLLKEPRLYTIYRNLTMPALRSLFEMESEGMLINREFLHKAIKEVKMLISRQRQRLFKIRQVAYYTDSKQREEQDKVIAEVEDKLHSRVEKSKEMAHDKTVKFFAKKEKPSEADFKAKYNGYYVQTKTEIDLKKKLKELKSGELQAYKGLNLASVPQMQDLLYFSESGFQFDSLDMGTGKDILNELPDTSGFIEGLLTYRSLKKTLGTYLEGLLDRMDKNDRIHTSFKLHGTVSGRLSSANPNLQNIPNTAKLSNEMEIHTVGLVKKSFSVPEGWTLMQFDYSQAELRIIASFSKDENMLNAYKSGQDLHALTAAAMLDKMIEEFYELDPADQKSARQKAKAVNFGLIYLISPEGFVEYAKNSYGVTVTLDEAHDIFDAFFSKYPRLKEYHMTYIQKGKKYGHVRTLYGRKRRLPNINDEDGFRASMDERASVNSPVQGTAGEFTIFSIALLFWRMDKSRIKFVNTVHDSILFYVRNDSIDYAQEVIPKTMENLPNKKYFGKELYGGISMKVDAEASTESWKDLQEL